MDYTRTEPFNKSKFLRYIHRSLFHKGIHETMISNYMVWDRNHWKTLDFFKESQKIRNSIFIKAKKNGILFIKQQMFDHGHVSNISIQRLLGVPYKLRMSSQQLHNTTAAAVHRIRFMDPWVQGGPIKVWLVPFWEDRCTVRKIPYFFLRGRKTIGSAQFRPSRDQRHKILSRW